MATDNQRKADVLVIQCGPAEPEPAKNVATNLQALRDATKERKPDFVVFTELSTTQYFCGYNDPKWFDVAEPLDGPSVKAFRDEAKRLGCYILVTFYERGTVKGEFFNSLAVICPGGELVPGTLPDGRQVRCYRRIASRPVQLLARPQRALLLQSRSWPAGIRDRAWAHRLPDLL